MLLEVSNTLGTIEVVEDEPLFPNVISIVSNGGTISSVKGVKGDAETEYRYGYVNLTPENIGFSIVNIETAQGTLSQAELKVLKGNLHNYIGYMPSEGQPYIFRLAVKNVNIWTYSALKIDLSGTMFIRLNVTTGEYEYSEIQSKTETELIIHTSDSNLHVSDEDRVNWDSKVSASVEPSGPDIDDNKLILN